MHSKCCRDHAGKHILVSKNSSRRVVVSLLLLLQVSPADALANDRFPTQRFLATSVEETGGNQSSPAPALRGPAPPALRAPTPPATPGNTQLRPAKPLPSVKAEQSQPSNESDKASNEAPADVKKVTLEMVDRPLLLSDAVAIADKNYPAILKAEAEARAAALNVTVQKRVEYVPESLFQTQYLAASRNKIVQNFWASTAFPAMAGPATSGVNFTAEIFSNVGIGLDWDPLDFGLHKSRIQLARKQAASVEEQAAVNRFDAEIGAISAYLDVIQAIRQVKATEENVRSIDEFLKIVDVQVKTLLKPAVDMALAQAELANARAQVFRAKLNLSVAESSFDNALGLADADMKVIDHGIADIIDHKKIQDEKPTFDEVPVMRTAKADLLASLAQKRVLKHEYDPTFHWIIGWNQRGGPVNPNGKLTGRDGYGLAPVYPNYVGALIINWNVLDIYRLRWERKVQEQRILARRHQVNLVLNNLKTLDRQSRARLQTAINVAETMPTEVTAAESAQKKAVTRYRVGLSSVAQVAESNQILARARMEQAIANVAVWRAFLEIASVHGDLKPLLAEADRVQRM